MISTSAQIYVLEHCTITLAQKCSLETCMSPSHGTENQNQIKMYSKQEIVFSTLLKSLVYHYLFPSSPLIHENPLKDSIAQRMQLHD